MLRTLEDVSFFLQIASAEFNCGFGSCVQFCKWLGATATNETEGRCLRKDNRFLSIKCIELVKRKAVEATNNQVHALWY